ncbi:c-type cytochrome biogenesis protein CcmI [Paraglaciecola aestuariivivens]
MMGFYMGAALCLIVVLGFVIYPWLVHTENNNNLSLDNQNLTKDRLRELDSEVQQGLLSDSDKQLAKDEITLALLAEQKTETSQTNSSHWPIMIGAVVSIVLGASVYVYANQISLIQQWQEAQNNTAELGKRMLQGDESLQIQDLQNFALGLRTKLASRPEDPMGWMLLGRVSGALKRVDSAIQAFEKSLQFDPNNTGTLASYAQALLMTGQEQQVLQAKRVLLHLLALEPDNTNAMGVLAIVASELGDRQLALENWQRLLPFIPKSDQNYQAIEERIAQLQAELGKSMLASDANQAERTAKGLSQAPKLEVTVEISPALIEKLPKQGMLFVFAQAADGQIKMPAAVVKQPLSQFPLTLVLSNQNAMVANYTVSQLKQAKIVARISQDENVALAPGELQGEQLIELDADNTQALTLTINREIQ